MEIDIEKLFDFRYELETFLLVDLNEFGNSIFLGPVEKFYDVNNFNCLMEKRKIYLGKELIGSVKTPSVTIQDLYDVYGNNAIFEIKQIIYDNIKEEIRINHGK